MYKDFSEVSLNEHIGYKLKTKRSLMKITQTELGNMLGVTCQQVQKYENGTNKISLENLYKISKLLSVDISYFFNGIEKENSVEESNELNFSTENDSIQKELTNLCKYFKKLKDDKVRKTILGLVKTLSSNQE